LTLLPRVLGCLLLVSLAGGCALWWGGRSAAEVDDEVARIPYRPDRRDYLAFRQAYSELLEPNYIPFMVHRSPGGPVAGDNLLLCRWPSALMPLRIFIEEAVIPEALQPEVRPLDPDSYTRAVLRALATWEEELEGLVAFERVHDPQDALFRLRILAREGPQPEPTIRVLGVTGELRKACRPFGWDPDSERMRVTYAVPEAILYAADEFGLLTPAQVEAVALHELGHVLGMMGHSPIPTDLMYAALGERSARDGLTPSDVNSFVSLYRLPNGTLYGNVPPGASPPRPDPGPPSSAPELSLSPHVDARQGFEVRTPARWLRSADAHGLFSANGPIWDHDASFEIFVWPYPTIEAYLERFSAALFADTWRRYSGPIAVDGRRGLNIAVEDPSGRIALDFSFVELGDGRVMVILAVCPVAEAEHWRPWFDAALGSLEIWPHSAEGRSK
jgi:hypothetical protein